MVLVPSSSSMLDDKNWYFPTWLKWIPRIEIDGSITEATPVEESKPATVGAPACVSNVRSRPSPSTQNRSGPGTCLTRRPSDCAAKRASSLYAAQALCFKWIPVMCCNSYLERAGVAQLVEHLPSKQDVAGSRPVPRSTHMQNPIPTYGRLRPYTHMRPHTGGRPGRCS